MLKLPEWLTRHELDPGNGAYDELVPQYRAALKSNIAALYNLWEGSVYGVVKNIAPQTTFISNCKPKDFAVFTFNSNYAAPAGIIAAILPAIIAGVEHILVCRAGESNEPLNPAISAALELLGQEDIYSLSYDDCALLISDIVADNAGCCGAVVSICNDEAGALAATAYSVKIPFIALPASVNINSSANNDTAELIAWLHGFTGSKSIAFDASAPVFAQLHKEHSIAPDFNFSSKIDLITAKGCEYFWVWPNLAPPFFLQTSITVTM